MSGPAGIVTLLTDFGQREPFVGVMKGVMLGRAPTLTFVDLSHDVPAHDVAFAAFWLGHAAPWFPRGTVHLCVVDPGVGTSRRVLVAESDGQVFVAPDNGVLSGVLGADSQVYSAPMGDDASRTFHGRDVFAPLAAELAAGNLRAPDVGEHIEDWVRLELPTPQRVGHCVRGVVTVVDHFGNLITNIRLGVGRRGKVRAGTGVSAVELQLVERYAEAGNRGAALVNAWGLVELAVATGRAADIFGLRVGDGVEIDLTDFTENE